MTAVDANPETSVWPRARAAGLTFRCVADDDLGFLMRLYASTRADELAVVPWSDAQKATFLDMQFRAQHTHYRTHYSEADWLVIVRGDENIGRLYLARWTDQFRVIDIALMPAHRGLGVGAALLRDLIDEAADAGKDVSIHVEKFNPAKRLYQRLGFFVAEDKGVYDLMRWTSATASPDRASTAQA